MKSREWDSAASAKGELSGSADRKSCFSEYIRYPYRNPTQVGRERILRRTGQLTLRNSANWLRNFGRRSASARRPQ